MANAPRGYGFTAEVEQKKKAKYDPELEQKAREFITQKTGMEINGQFQPALKDGVILAHFANAIKPGSIKKINESKMAFKMMENIANFLQTCEEIGMAKLDLFQTVDLYDNKNIPLVIDTILAVKRKLDGGESTPNVRNFSEEQMRAGQGVIGLQMGSNKGASQKGMSYGSVRQIRPEDNVQKQD